VHDCDDYLYMAPSKDGGYIYIYIYIYIDIYIYIKEGKVFLLDRNRTWFVFLEGEPAWRYSMNNN